MITKYGAPPEEVSEEACQESTPGNTWTNVDPHAETEKIPRQPAKPKAQPAEAPT